MARYRTEIHELRLRFVEHPEPGTLTTYTRELRWSCEAPNEHEARRMAMIAWGCEYGEEPQLPFALDVRPAEAD
jgi:hypothetical protein